MTLTNCPVEYRRTVLAALGGQLLRLKLDNCKDLDLTDLKICSQLKELEMDYGCEFLPSPVKAEEPLRLPYGSLSDGILSGPEEDEEANQLINELQQRSSSIDLVFEEDCGECCYNPLPQEEDED